MPSPSRQIPSTDLMLDASGRLPHLRLLPGQAARTVLLVGDPGRVSRVARLLDRPSAPISNREFCTVTGYYGGEAVSVVSTGIGASGVDIVLQELDALHNIDLAGSRVKEQFIPLRFVRIGTSGAVAAGIPTGDVVVTTAAIGLDSLPYFYRDVAQVLDYELGRSFTEHLPLPQASSAPYAVRSAPGLVEALAPLGHRGITLSVPSFYGAQGRELRLHPALDQMVERASAFAHGGERILNMEMESASVNALARLLGHSAITLTLVIDNRVSQEHTFDMDERMDQLLSDVLARLFPA